MLFIESYVCVGVARGNIRTHQTIFRTVIVRLFTGVSYVVTCIKQNQLARDITSINKNVSKLEGRD